MPIKNNARVAKPSTPISNKSREYPLKAYGAFGDPNAPHMTATNIGVPIPKIIFIKVPSDT